MRRKKTLEEFIEEANRIHNNLYDYENFIYINYKTKGIIVCSKHGGFLQTPSNHLYGFACEKCAKEKLRSSRAFTIKQFIEKSNIIHNYRYDYSKFIYLNSCTKGVIICPVHGEFDQTPANHFVGKGCPECGKQRAVENKTSSKSVFINKANLIHHKSYIYDKVFYKNARTKVCIICKLHGEFEQTPDSHLRGSGCPRCCHMISKKSQVWLDSFNNPNIIREYTIKTIPKIYKVDGFDPITNTVYEFYGDMWHGNPNKFKSGDINRVNKKTFGQLYNNTMARENELKSAGYNFVYIWESDFTIS